MAQRDAGAAVALLLRPATDDPPDRLAVAVACRGIIAAAAASGPLLVAVYDGQWLDEATADALRFAVRRVTVAPLAMVIARRPSADGDRRFGDGLPSARTLLLAPLSLGAIHAIIQAQLGLTLDRPRLLRLHELSAGNPFYAVELARAHASGVLTLTTGEPLPPSLESLVGGRISALPVTTVLLLATAAMTAAPSLRLLGDVHPSVDVRGGLEPAAAAGVIRLPGGPDGTVGFNHPLLASAAIATLTVDERRALHLALSDSVADAVERARISPRR